MRTRPARVRNIVLHVLFLIVLFTGSVLFFERTINQSAPDEAQTMDASTFPLVYMVRNGTAFNCLHGYSRQMDVSRLRDSITPLKDDRTIGIQVQAFSAAIDSISYEVMSLDGTDILENTQVIKTETSGDTISASLQLQNRMLMDQEYMMQIEVVSGGRSLYYYTRVLLSDGLHTDDYLNAVTGFYEKTVNRTDLDSVAAVVEPDETTDAEQSLAYMDIHDSVDQLTWSQLRPQIYYKPTPKITEINSSTATLTMEYRISSVNEDGRTEVFNVDESYRVRYTDSRVFVLNFDRTTNEIFDPDNDVLESTGIRLGITGKDVEYKADSRGRVIAFIQENELWTYEPAAGRLTQIFSFPQKENMDARDFYDASDIRILRVETSGDVYFTVAGYMNRGQHEGDNGVALYHYEESTDMVEELIFLQSMEQYDMLERDVNTLAYVTGDESAFYVYLDGSLYRADLSDRTVSVLASGIGARCYAGSAQGRYFAWLEEGDEFGSRTLNLIDVVTQQIQTITAAEGERIRPVCFMNEDLVYGLAREEDLQIATLSTGYFPMYTLKIVDGSGSELMTYQPDGYYVTQVTASDHMLSLTRVTKENGTFVEAPADQIMDTNNSDSVSMGTATKSTTRKETIVYLRVGTTLSDTQADVVRSKIVAYASPRTVSISESADRQYVFYVYASGHLQDVFTKANMAIASADQLFGVVMDSEWNYVWVRGDKDTTAQVQMDKVPQAMRSGGADEQTLAEGIDGKVFDLTGCTLDEVEYYISRGYAVQAVGDDGAVTIVGYDEYNTHLLRPGEEEWYYYGVEDSTAMFENHGNTFYAYIP